MLELPPSVCTYRPTPLSMASTLDLVHTLMLVAPSLLLMILFSRSTSTLMPTTLRPLLERVLASKVKCRCKSPSSAIKSNPGPTIVSSSLVALSTRRARSPQSTPRITSTALFTSMKLTLPLSQLTMLVTTLPAISTMLQFVSQPSILTTSALFRTKNSTLLTQFILTSGTTTALPPLVLSVWELALLSGAFSATQPPSCSTST